MFRKDEELMKAEAIAHYLNEHIHALDQPDVPENVKMVLRVMLKAEEQKLDALRAC